MSNKINVLTLEPLEIIDGHMKNVIHKSAKTLNFEITTFQWSNTKVSG